MAFGEQFDSVLQAAQLDAGWAYDRLYRWLSPSVCGYLRMQGAADPEDLTSEVFLGAFQAIGSFEGGEAQFRSWVFTIAHRRLQDERRRLARHPHLAEIDPELTVPGGDVEREALDALGAQWVVRASAALSPDQRTVLLLRVVADLTAEQVAAITGKRVGAVRALQRRGLGAMRRILAREGVRL